MERLDCFREFLTFVSDNVWAGFENSLLSLDSGTKTVDKTADLVYNRNSLDYIF